MQSNVPGRTRNKDWIPFYFLMKLTLQKLLVSSKKFYVINKFKDKESQRGSTLLQHAIPIEGKNLRF